MESLKSIPSVDRILSSPGFATTLTRFGHHQCTDAIRAQLELTRQQVRQHPETAAPDLSEIINRIHRALIEANKNTLRPVINLTGTVLHTNLGRAFLPEVALNAIADNARHASNLEFDLDTGRRGDRDDHVTALIQELTGAEAVTVVNNNAAAVLLCLNTLAEGSEVCISRGELVEIGGSFRIPEVMEKSGCGLVEVGATNRTHLKDYKNAVSPQTALFLKVHTSNYEIRGFTEEVSYEALGNLAREEDIPFLADLGSGTLVDLEQYGLNHEPTVQEVLSAGVDVVTFSGDKLLGGPQAGIIAGRKDLIERIKQNPLKRALRVDKMTLSALTEVLKLYRQPERLADELPTIRYLARTPDQMTSIAEALLPTIRHALIDRASVRIIDTMSQIGSGALPLDQLPSLALEITPTEAGDTALQTLSHAFRRLPTPVIGRLADGRLLFDLRTLDNAALVADQLHQLHIG